MKIILVNILRIAILIFLIFTTQYSKSDDKQVKYSAYIDSLQNELKNSGLKDTFKLEVLQSLVREFINIDISIAENYNLESEEIINKNNNPYWKANSYNTSGLLYWSKSDFKKALDLFLQSAKINDSLKNEIGLLRNFGNIGLLNYSTQNYDKAIEYTTKAMKLAEKLKMKRELALSYGNLGIIYQSTQKFKESLIYHTKALKITQEMEDRRGIIRNLSNIAVVHTSMDNFSEAIKKYSEALDLAIQEQDNRSIVLLEGNLGVTYFQIATDSARGPNNPDRKNYLKLSEQNLLRAIELAKTMNFTDALYEYYPSISRTYAELDDFKNALRYNDLYYAIKDSLFSIENNKAVNDLQSKFEKQLVEKENLLLKKDNQVKQITIYASVVIIFLILAGLYFVYQNNKITRRLNVELEEKNQKISDAKLELERLLELISAKNIELEVTNDELAQTNATKDKLFSIISHDLRNPLQAILLNSDLMHNFKSKMPEDEQLDRISKILESSNNLNKLLEDLLQWSRTQMKRIELHPVDFDLKSLVNVVINLYSEQANQKEIRIENNVPEKLILNADMNLINTVFRNLISNAIKFTPNGGLVQIGCDSEDENLCNIYVKDSGIGIPKENLEKLFSISNSFTTRGTNNESGTGLGLILVKEFVNLNNGEISVDSVTDKGTTFKIKLPKSSSNLVNDELG